jgi:hypothetical protein
MSAKVYGLWKNCKELRLRRPAGVKRLSECYDRRKLTGGICAQAVKTRAILRGLLYMWREQSGENASTSIEAVSPVINMAARQAIGSWTPDYRTTLPGHVC